MLAAPALRSALGALVAGALVLAPVLPAQAAGPLAGVDGEGTESSPYLLDSAADLDAFAAAVNQDAATYGATFARLEADIDYAGATFVGIDAFSGVFDGAGRTISDIVYGPSAASEERALFRTLTGAQVRDLRIDGVSASTTANARVAGLAIDALEGTRVEGNAIVGADLVTPHDYAGGLVAEMESATVITGNSVIDARVTSARYAAGIAGYARWGGEITKNFVQAEVATTGPSAFGGMVAAYAGNNSNWTAEPLRVAENVVHSGSVSVAAGGEEADMGRVVSRPRTDGFVVEHNLVGDAVTLNGLIPEAPGVQNKNGTTVDASALAAQQTYADLGWVFDVDWRWDTVLAHPVPAAFEVTPEGPLAGIAGDGSEASPFQVRTAAGLDTVAAAINADAAAYGDAFYTLAADIDYAGATFVGIDTFTGVFDGAGHTIRNLVYGPSATSQELALFRVVQGAVIEDLSLDGVVAQTAAVQRVAGLVLDALNGTRLEGNSVVNAELSTAHDYAGGLAAKADTDVVVTNNLVKANVTSARYPAAVAAYARKSVELTKNFVEATVHSTGSSAYGGMLIGYSGNANAQLTPVTRTAENVVYGGAVTYEGQTTVGAGRVVAYTRTPEAGFVTENNLVNEAVTVGGEIPAGAGEQNKNGTAVGSDVLADPWTYADLGWDFQQDWRWDAQLQQPVPVVYGDGVEPQPLPDREPEPQPDLGLPMDGIEGLGTEADPYQVRTAANLTRIAEAINADAASYASRHYRLTANIDYRGGAFTGIDTFSGVFDGAGHKIFNITWAAGSIDVGDVKARELAMFRVLDGATVRGLTLEGLTVTELEDFRVAGIAVEARNGTVLDGNSVLDAAFRSGHQYTAAIAANAHDGVQITNNWVTGEYQSARYTGAVAGYIRYGVEIRNNLVDAVVTSRGARAHGAMLASYEGAFTAGNAESRISDNVLIGGEVSYVGGGTAVGPARVVAVPRTPGFVHENNLADESITVAGELPDGPGELNKNGTSVPAADLAKQETYEALGWDFAGSWRWDDVLQHPVPERSYLFGAGTESAPFEIRGAEDLEFLALASNAGDTTLQGDVRVVLTGDLDFAGRAPYPGIDAFGGVLDGHGHTISNISYGPSAASDELGLVRELSGTVTGLNLDGVTVDGGSAAAPASALVVRAVGTTDVPAVVERITLTNAVVTAPAAEVAAGLVASATFARITTNDVDAHVTGAAASALVGAPGEGAEVSSNLVAGDVLAGTGGAGLVAAAPEPGATITRNVVLGGTVSSADAGLAGRVAGDLRATGWSAERNLASVATVVNDAPITASDDAARHGEDASEAVLTAKATYDDLAWDFMDGWRWDTADRRAYVKHLLPEEMPNRITTTFAGDPTTQRAFSWYQQADTDAPKVILSTDRSFPAGPATVEVAAEKRPTASGETVYQALATDLQPGNTYYYRLGDSLTGLWSPTGTFETPTGEGDFTFIDLTDTQAKAQAEADLSAATLRKALDAVPEAEFVVHNGDVVQDGHIEQDWIDLLDASQDGLLRTTIAPAAGNHEDTQSSFVDHFALEHPNGQDTTTGAYYSYTYNSAHFMVLNTNEDAEEGISDAQLEWLKRDAASAREAGADWLILVMHKGVYTAANHATDADIHALREKIVPVIDELDIDLALQGHDHYLSRTKVLQSAPDEAIGARAVETTQITEVVNGVRIQYNVSPDGTLYLNPNKAGAKRYGQVAESELFDLEAYLNLFDRLGTPRQGVDAQTFTAVNVTDHRLTVETFHITAGGSPRLAEGFGIDRRVSEVRSQLALLPDAMMVLLAHAGQIADARAAVNALTDAQRGALDLTRLDAAEQRLRELQGLVSTDGSAVAWADPAATERQPIAVRNDSERDFTDVPVRLTLQDTPDVAVEELAFTDADASPLSFEVEHWEPGAASTVWVKLPALPKFSAPVVWAYFGGGSATNDPTDVWSGGYALVEHFDEDLAAGGSRVDSTGRAVGTLEGAELSTEVSPQATGTSRFDGSRLEYAGDVGGGFGNISVSGVYSFTPEDLAAMDGQAAVVAKGRMGEESSAFVQAVSANDGTLTARLGSGVFAATVPADGRPHLVTQHYDGMTYAVFVDGEQQFEMMAEKVPTLSDFGVSTTIGDFHSDNGRLASPFRGVIDEVQIAGIPFVPEFEAFRYDNYFGDAVEYGPRSDRAGDPVALVVGSPAEASEIEAGLTEFTGSVSKRSVLTATVAGEEVFRETVDAGAYDVDVPVNALGSQTVTLTATAEGGETSSAEVVLEVSDTAAPGAPALAQTDEPGSVTLSATPQTDDREAVQAQFFASPAIELTPENVSVRTGSTPDRVPTALAPDAGEPGDGMLPTTVGDDQNPFQIYKIALTEEQAAQPEFHLTWSGTGDDRRISAWMWDHGAGQWLLKDSAADTAGGGIQLDIEALVAENAVGEDRSLTMLVWRGLTEEPWGENRVYEQYPDPADFDWAFNHVPDTQLYAESTPWMMTDQFEYLVDSAAERKTELVIQAGDWVNREYLDDEYQWQGAEPSARLLEEAGIPMMVSWGNHDYSEDRNGRLMLEKYFPMERFQQSLDGSPFTFGGSYDIDNSYYEAEIDGAKLLFVALSYWSANTDDDPGIAWASDVIAAHPDHTVILATHDYMYARDAGNPYTNPRINDLLVDQHPNIALVLAGHNSGSYVADRQPEHGTRSYGILTDYQTRPWGGHEFLKNLSVDAENGLLYVNTYSPWLDSWISDGRWHSPISENDVAGFHGDDSENFVLELDLGGVQTRTLAATGLTLSAGEPIALGAAQPLVGAQAGTATVTAEAEPEAEAGRNVLLRLAATEVSVPAGVEHEWFVELTDAAGHVTRSATGTFTVTAAVPDPGTDPGDPGTDPGDPGTDPGDPGTEPGDPGTEPGEPGTEPGQGVEPGAGDAKTSAGTPAAEGGLAETGVNLSLAVLLAVAALVAALGGAILLHARRRRDA